MALTKISSISRKSLEKATRLVSQPSKTINKTLTIEKAVLPSLSIDGNGELIAVFHDGSFVNLGRVVGDPGKIPDHQVKNGEIRFEKPDGSWGPWIRVAESKVIHTGGGISQSQIDIIVGSSKERNVRITNTDTTVLPDDDIIIVTGAATVTLPDGFTFDKLIKIKRSGAFDVTVQGVLGQLVEGEAFRVINVNLYALELRFDEVNTWVEL